jgi:hypothetical protein
MSVLFDDEVEKLHENAVEKARAALSSIEGATM